MRPAQAGSFGLFRKVVLEMRKKIAGWLVLFGMALVFAGTTGYAKENTENARSQEVICEGVYAEDIDLSGMTVEEAEDAINEYVESFAASEITLVAGENHTVTVTAADLGLSWANPEILTEAAGFGKKGNVVKRYMEMTDLSHENVVYDIAISFDRRKIRTLIAAQSEFVDTEAVNPILTREEGEFVVIPGVKGAQLDVYASVDVVYQYLMEEWNRKDASMELTVAVVEPEYKDEDFAKVQDVLVSCTTSFSTSDSARSANVRNACNKVNGTILYPGEEFSTLATIAPFTTQNGYYAAGSYAGGKVVDSVGGGICQVSSTLYNAVLYADLEVTDRSNHAMVVSYVKVGMDATVSEDSGIDFKFRNNTDYPIYIEGYTTPNKRITITIYGADVREEGYEVSYISNITSTTPPGPELVYADAGQPVGYINVQPAHTGYVADVYKVVTENGVEVSREQITHSVYKMTPRSVTVGVATSDPTTYAVLQAAIATGSVDYVRAVVNQLATGTYGGPYPDTTVPTDPSVETGAPAGTVPEAAPVVPDTTVPPATVPDGTQSTVITPPPTAEVQPTAPEGASAGV